MIEYIDGQVTISLLGWAVVVVAAWGAVTLATSLVRVLQDDYKPGAARDEWDELMGRYKTHPGIIEVVIMSALASAIVMVIMFLVLIIIIATSPYSIVLFLTLLLITSVTWIAHKIKENKITNNN